MAAIISYNLPQESKQLYISDFSIKSRVSGVPGVTSAPKWHETWQKRKSELLLSIRPLLCLKQMDLEYISIWGAARCCGLSINVRWFHCSGEPHVHKSCPLIEFLNQPAEGDMMTLLHLKHNWQLFLCHCGGMVIGRRHRSITISLNWLYNKEL